MSDRREMTTGEAAAWDAGYAAGLNAARFADPRWCIRDKNTACASRDCTAEWCARVDQPETRARPIPPDITP